MQRGIAVPILRTQWGASLKQQRDRILPAVKQRRVQRRVPHAVSRVQRGVMVEQKGEVGEPRMKRRIVQRRALVQKAILDGSGTLLEQLRQFIRAAQHDG